MSRDSRALWVEDNDVLHCRNCKAVFSLFRRKHHCRLCGQIFCSHCIVNLNPTSFFPWPTRTTRDVDRLPSSLGKLCIHCYDRQSQQQQLQQQQQRVAHHHAHAEARSAQRWRAETREEDRDRAPVQSPVYHSPLSAQKKVLPVSRVEKNESAHLPPATKTPEPMGMPTTTTTPESSTCELGRGTPPLAAECGGFGILLAQSKESPPALVDGAQGHATRMDGYDENDDDDDDDLVWGLEDPLTRIKPPSHLQTGNSLQAMARVQPPLPNREELPFVLTHQRHHKNLVTAPVTYEYYKKEQPKASLLFCTTFIRNNFATSVEEKMLRSIWEHVSALASTHAAALSCSDPSFSVGEWTPLLVSSAWEAVGKTVIPIGRFPQEHIMVLWERSEQRPRGDVVDGIVLQQLLLSKRMRSHLYNPKILLVAGDLSYYSASEGNSVRVLDGYKGYLNSIWHRIQRWAPDLLLVEGDMHHYLQSTIIEQGQMSVVLNVGTTMLRRIAAAAQATIIKDLDYANEADLLRTDIMGAIKEYKQVCVEDGTLRTILRGFAVPLYSTIVLQGPFSSEETVGDLVRVQMTTVVTLFHLTLLAHAQMDFGIGTWIAAAPSKKTEPIAARLWQNELTYNGDQVQLEDAEGADGAVRSKKEVVDSVMNCLTLRKVRLELSERPPSSTDAEENLNRRTYYNEHVADTYAFYEGGSDTALSSFLMQTIKEEHVHFLYAHGHTKIRLTKRAYGVAERSKGYHCQGGTDAVECFSRAWKNGRYGPQSATQASKSNMSPPYCYSCCNQCEERRRNGETLTVSLCSPFTLNMSMGAFLEYLCYASDVTSCPMCGGVLASSSSSSSSSSPYSSLKREPQFGCAGLIFCFVLFPSSEALARVEVRFHVSPLQCCTVHYPAAGSLLTDTNGVNGASDDDGNNAEVHSETMSLMEDTSDCYVTAENKRVYTSEPSSVLRAVLLMEGKGVPSTLSLTEKFSCFTASVPGETASGASFTNTHTLRVTPLHTQTVREINYTVDVLYGNAFFGLRQLLSGDPHDEGLLTSLARCSVFRAEGGKASADFYRSHDHKLLLKLVKYAELYHISSMGPAYFRYLAQCFSKVMEEEDPGAPIQAATALVPLLGLYVVRASFTQMDGTTVHQEPRHFLLMENIRSKIPRAHLVDQVYDLKGSQRNRVAPKGSNVRLDVDFVYETQKGNFFFCTTVDKVNTMSILRADSRFLQACWVTDYSLCVLLATYALAQTAGESSDGKDVAAPDIMTTEAERHIWLGIIDYLHPYNGAKRIESRVKSGIDTVLGGSVHDPTIIDPVRYQQRFLKWMHNYFCSVPNRFETEAFIVQMDRKLHALTVEELKD